jgi:2-deoxy-D-gluconate 3-dehydrogenase
MRNNWDCLDFCLDSKTVLIAGIGGLGSAIAQAVSRTGANVLLADIDLMAAKKIAKIIQKERKQCELYKMNILNPAEIGQAIKYAQRIFGSLDVAINCVGVNIRKPSLTISEKEWNKVLDVNLKGAFFFAQKSATFFIEQKRRGKIIFLASLLSFVGMENRAAYVASKAGLVGLIKSLAVEWAKYNININAVAPSFIPTPLNRHTLKGEFKQKIIERTPFRRLGQPEDIVGAVVFLASDASNFITGQTILVDGGWLSG